MARSKKTEILGGKYNLIGYGLKSKFNVFGIDVDCAHITEQQAEYLVSKKFIGIEKAKAPKKESN